MTIEAKDMSGDASSVLNMPVAGKSTNPPKGKKESTDARLARLELAIGDHQDALSEVTEGMVNIDDDASRIKTATMYLSDDAILWWRRRQAEEIRLSRSVWLTNDIIYNFK